MEPSCPAPKHCEYGRKMASAASEAHETPRLSATFSSHDPFKTARLNQAGRKNKLRHSCGVTATLATKNHKTLYSLLRDQEVACSQTPRSSVPRPVPVACPGGPVPVPVPVARSRARSRWPGPGGPVAVARSRWPGPGPALRARARGPAQKKTYSVERDLGFTVLLRVSRSFLASAQNWALSHGFKSQNKIVLVLLGTRGNGSMTCKNPMIP